MIVITPLLAERLVGIIRYTLLPYYGNYGLVYLIYARRHANGIKKGYCYAGVIGLYYI